MFNKGMSKLISGLFLTLLTTASFAYQAIDLNIGRSVAFGYSTNLDQRRFGLAANGLIGFGDEEGRMFAPAIRYNLIPINGESFLDNVYVNLAGYVAKMGKNYDEADVNAIGFGGGARIKLLDEYSLLHKPLYLAGGINYAPPGTTYKDGNNLLYWNARVEYPILERSLVYVGYRQVTADLNDVDGRDVKNAGLDKTAFIGIHFVW